MTGPPPHRHWLVLAMAGAVILADQATKAWALAGLSDRPPVSLLGQLLRLRLVHNSGAAFGLGAGHTWVFTVAAAIAVAALGYTAGKVRHRGWAVAIGLLLGGAASHLLDRLTRPPGFGRGHVVDFIDYAGLFVGNLADIALTVAVAAIVVLTLRGTRLAGQPEPAPPPGTGPHPG